jgi:hypothetical protein
MRATTIGTNTKAIYRQDSKTAKHTAKFLAPRSLFVIDSHDFQKKLGCFVLQGSALRMSASKASCLFQTLQYKYTRGTNTATVKNAISMNSAAGSSM